MSEDDNAVSEEDAVVDTGEGERYAALSANKSGESDDE
ncbi:hypothetical protein HNR49_001479 [Halobacterium salinarum]|uniref:Uncharacterized protein n=1 Tax=Halobacterium salinarum TaxID=2242 RepID=A0A841HBK7_HALSI|nr:hypothetical protein [Halobacterium salinarum]